MNNAAIQSEESSFDEARERREFIRDEVFRLTVMGALQRNKVYKQDGDRVDPELFRCFLRKHLEVIAEGYRKPVTDEVHIKNIKLLAEKVSGDCPKLLRDGKFRIGTAQKALNLFLKYLWCLDQIPQPPHCPFDRRIIECLPKDVQCNWTECKDIDHCKRWVDEARRKAETGGFSSVAEWELATCNK